eukprot:8046166-Ditylum_brightwellii.AAC.2
MLDSEGQIVGAPPKFKMLIVDNDIDDFGFDEPVEASVDEAWIDSVISDYDKTDFYDMIETNGLMPYHEMVDFADTSSNQLILGKIGAVMGKSPFDDIDISCPLFIATLDGLEDEFMSELLAATAETPRGVLPDLIKKIWSISDEQAQDVVNSNTQLNHQTTDGLLSQQFSTNDMMPRYCQINSYFYTDTMHMTKKEKSTCGNLHLQVFISDKGFIVVYPMERKSDFKDCLHQFCKEVGAPISLVVDPTGKQISKEVWKFCNQVGTTL